MMETEVNFRSPKPPLIDQSVPLRNVNWPIFLFICAKDCVSSDYHKRPSMKKISELDIWKLLSQPTYQQVIDIGQSVDASANDKVRAQHALNRREEFLAQNLLPRAQYIFDKKTDTYRKPIPADHPTGSKTMPVDMMFIPETYHVVGNRLMSEFGEMLFK